MADPFGTPLLNLAGLPIGTQQRQRTAQNSMRISRPPGYPWRELGSYPNASGGFLMIYYSDDLSAIPVRFVTKPGDNKSDPNIETLTFGLFSTCGRRLRSTVVRRREPYIFFATRKSRVRLLSGYYHIRWYTQGVFAEMNDICLAADEARFICPGIYLDEVDRKCETQLARRFRGYMKVDPDSCRRIVSLLNLQDDALTPSTALTTNTSEGVSEASCKVPP